MPLFNDLRTYDDRSFVRHVFFLPGETLQKTGRGSDPGRMLFQCLDQAGEGELQPHEVYFLDKWLLDDTHLRIFSLVVWCMVHKGFCNRTLSLLLGYFGLFCVRFFDDLMFV